MMDKDELKYKTLCVSGHRRVGSDLDIDKLRYALNTFIDNGFERVMVGMAVGFDTICFHILEEIRKQKKVKIIACIPCPQQDKPFSLEQKKEYRRMVESADERVILSECYTPYCMIKRNRYMVDNSIILIAYLNDNKGGTFSTVNYAKEKKIQTLILPRDLENVKIK